MSSERFRDQVVVISGAAGALGTAVAHTFAAEGARLALLGHRLTKLQAAAAALPDALLLEADLTKEDDVQQAFAQTVEQYGGIDILVNTVGGFTMNGKLHETDVDDWTKMLDVNARSAFLTCRAALSRMVERGSGKIVNTAAASVFNLNSARMTPYVVSKAAIVRLTQALAAEYRRQNINVNCILPGTIDTEDNRRSMPKADHSKWVAPEQIARVILFLCSQDAAIIHGAAVPVTGRS